MYCRLFCSNLNGYRALHALSLSSLSPVPCLAYFPSLLLSFLASSTSAQYAHFSIGIDPYFRRYIVILADYDSPPHWKRSSTRIGFSDSRHFHPLSIDLIILQETDSNRFPFQSRFCALHFLINARTSKWTSTLTFDSASLLAHIVIFGFVVINSSFIRQGSYRHQFYHSTALLVAWSYMKSYWPIRNPLPWIHGRGLVHNPE